MATSTLISSWALVPACSDTDRRSSSEAVKAQLDAGFETGPIHPMAGEVAGLVQELTGAERVGFCSTGSEAVLAAIRVSRTVTARDKIVIFEGAYHGIFDEVLARPLVRNGELRSMPTAPGIPDGSFGEIIVLQYGNPESLEIIEQYGDEIAAVLVEPVQSRRLDLVPKEFLLQLRQITAATGTALVFDEVVTGFRVEPGGAQAYFGIDADLATYGKVVGGGLPIGIVTGQANVHGRSRWRPLAVWRRFGAGSRRHVLRRHVCPPSAGVSGREVSVDAPQARRARSAGPRCPEWQNAWRRLSRTI